VKKLADAQPSDIPKESRYLLEISHRPNKLTLDIEDAYWVAAMKAAKKGLLRCEQATEKQGAGARRKAVNISRNLLVGVSDSLQIQLRLSKSTPKRPGEQKGHTTKRRRNENLALGSPQPSQGTLIALWERLYPDIFIFGQSTWARSPTS
jgi:hypothetical protein